MTTQLMHQAAMAIVLAVAAGIVHFNHDAPVRVNPVNGPKSLRGETLAS